MDKTYEFHLFNACNTRQFAIDRNWEVGTSKYQSPIAVPDDECFGMSPVALQAHEFVCLDKSSTFIAGTPVDYLYHKTGNYTEACKAYVQKYSEYLADKLPFDVNYLVSLAAFELSIHRDIFLWVNGKMRRRDMSLNGGIAETWLKGRNIEIEKTPMHLFTGTGDDVRELLELVAPLQGKPVNLRISLNNPVVFLPFFSTYSRVSYIKIVDCETCHELSLVLDDRPVSYFGMHAVDPRTERVRLSLEPLQAAALASHYRTLEPGNHYISPSIRGDLKDPFLIWKKFQAATLLRQPEESLHAITTIANVAKYLYIGDDELALPPSKAINWQQFLLSFIHLEIRRAGVINADLFAWIDSFQLNPSLLEKLLTKLRQDGAVKAADQLAEWLQRDIIQSDNWILRETDFGYELMETGLERKRLITNFTFKLENRVVFDDDGSIYYKGDYNGTKRQTVLVPEAALTKPIQLCREINKRLHYTESEKGPALLESRSGAYLNRLWARRQNLVSTIKGVSRLGWTLDNQSFIAPGWRVDGDYIITGESMPLPDDRFLSHFAYDEQSVDVHSKRQLSFEPSMEDLLSVFACWVARSYNDEPVQPVAVKDDHNSRSLLTHIFKLLKQTELWKFNSNPRALTYETKIPVSGFPFLGAGYTKFQINQSSLPAVILCDQGLEIDDALPPNRIVSTAQLILTILSRTAAGLLAGRIRHSMVDTGDPIVDMIGEGRTILHAIPSIRDRMSLGSKLLALEVYFNCFNTTTIVNAATYDYRKQLAYFNLRHTPNVATDRFLADIKTLDPNATYIQDPASDLILQLDLLTAQSIIQARFGESVRIPSLDDQRNVGQDSPGNRSTVTASGSDG